MWDTQVKILDYTTLIQLNETLDYAADSLLRIKEGVNQYFDFVLDQMQRQVDELANMMNEAKQRLDDAESDLSSCESSQRWDDDDKCYYPSCDSEKAYVNSARHEYEELRDKYEEAKNILSDVKYEIDRYHQRPGIIIPGGAEFTLEYTAKDHTDSATKKMNEIIETVEEYLGAKSSLNGECKTVSEIHSEAIKALDAEKEGSNDEKAGQFREASKQIREDMARETPANAYANELVICSYCHRPSSLCICQRLREKER